MLVMKIQIAIGIKVSIENHALYGCSSRELSTAWPGVRWSLVWVCEGPQSRCPTPAASSSPSADRARAVGPASGFTSQTWLGFFFFKNDSY